MLNSYGMAAIDLLDAGSNPLQLAPGKQVDIVMPVSATKKSTAKPTILLWHFDETDGLWKQEGQATLDGDKYVGKVSHFSWWNCDDFMYTRDFCLEIFIDGVLAPNLSIEVHDKVSGMRAWGTISINGDGSLRRWAFFHSQCYRQCANTHWGYFADRVKQAEQCWRRRRY